MILCKVNFCGKFPIFRNSGGIKLHGEGEAVSRILGDLASKGGGLKNLVGGGNPHYTRHYEHKAFRNDLLHQERSSD